jgi:hypothetical protein
VPYETLPREVKSPKIDEVVSVKIAWEAAITEPWAIAIGFSAVPDGMPPDEM